MSAVVGVGLDFGTTNSGIAIATDRGVEAVPLDAEGSVVMPSVVYLDESRQRLAGDQAVRQYLVSGHRPDTRLMSSLKSFLADDLWHRTAAPCKLVYMYMHAHTCMHKHRTPLEASHSALRIDRRSLIHRLQQSPAPRQVTLK